LKTLLIGARSKLQGKGSGSDYLETNVSAGDL
jgi:hypothetical protein